MITINDKKYKVISNLGFQHSRGVYAKVVETKDGEKIAIKPSGGSWSFSTPLIIPTNEYVGQ